MNAFSRSWLITKLSFSVINKDRELLWFAILSFLFSGLYLLAMLVPLVWFGSFEDDPEGGQRNLELIEYVIIFVAYFGLAFVATFFNVCVVYTSKVRFEGGDATFGESFRFAMTRLGLIFQWSLVSASVGLLLRILENASRNLGKGGQIVSSIILSLVGMAWGIVTIFVVPGIVYDGLGPFDAIKKSVEVIKKTWGESLIRHFGLGLIQFIAVFAIIVVSAGLTYGLSMAFDSIGMLIGIGFGVLMLLLSILVFGVATSIFNTALYVYATKGTLASGFDQDTMRSAFRTKT
ncbi:MAG TPA: DUF6159 family protein [Cyclobacteriaceae bacterium]|nr:DUF6159 family protein [Cyclobacteriaceae bacterium]